MATATGLLVPAYRTLVEFYPPHDESQLLMDFSRLKIVYQIMERMGIPLTVRNNIHIIKGEQNRMIGGPTRFVHFLSFTDGIEHKDSRYSMGRFL
jgi:hypothetical protein